MPRILNALTIDVEDYFQVSAFEKDVRREDWDRFESRVVENTRRITRLLGRRELRATFFVLGWIADRHPRLVREIHAAGHEIASHGYWHHLIYEQSAAEFRRDIRRSRAILEDLIGEPVVAYRAPSFSITRQSLWAFDILVEEGFRVDSSVFPIRHDRYGIPDAALRLHRIATAAGPLWEFPPSVAQFGPARVPVGGGGYFRLFPFRWTAYALGRINRVEGEPFMFYFHPWELDPGQPRLPIRSRLSRWRHYVNLHTTERKLDALTARFRFGRLCDVVAVAPSPTAAAREPAHAV